MSEEYQPVQYEIITNLKIFLVIHNTSNSIVVILFSILLRLEQHRKISSRNGMILPAITVIEATTAATTVIQYILLGGQIHKAYFHNN